jgi:tRNA G46 methylase TrmB
MEAESIARLCQSETLLSKSKGILVNLLESRLLYFCGGGTTDLNAVKNYSYTNAPVCADAVRMQLLSSLWHSFGLSTAVHRNGQSEKKRKYNGGKLDKSSDVSIPDSLKDRFKSSIQQDGFIDFTHIFRPLWDDSFQPLIGEDGLVKTSQIKPINIELGSGSGDWIVGQAVENPSVNYVAVELRADRVAQTFAKLTLNPNGSVKNLLAVPLCNLCCVGSECGVFLKDRVKNHSISKIFVNHPEPPTQTYGAEGNSILPKLETEEPAHMLNSCTLLHAAQCLKPDSEGQLIIVTDNLWYARLICLTLVKLLSQHSKVLQQTDLGSDHSLRLFQSFSVPNGRENVELYVRHGTVHPDTKKNLQLDEINGTSYFDRLWRAGGGKHAHKMDRYIIAMQTCPKCNVVVGSESRSTIATKVSQNHNKLSNATTTATRSKRKRKARSPQKQALRNRRRLEKRSIEL